jgi:cysteine desulfurase
MLKLGAIAVSAGSACHSGSTETSPVLKAMGISHEAAISAIRFSLGKGTTQEEIDQVIKN